MHTYGYGDGASEGDLVAAVNINIELNPKKKLQTNRYRHQPSVFN